MVNTDLIILGMIYFQPSHGYKIKKNVKYFFGNPYFKLNNNVLYSTLTKLQKNGFIKGEVVSSEKMNKKVYHITEDGKKHLMEMVATPVNPEVDDFDFKVQAVFFDLITKEIRMKVIKPLYDSKLKILQDALKKKEEYGSILSPVSGTVLEFGIKELKNSLEFYEKLMNLE
jgi:DNA-binding PadR family transcriptional regulator